MCLSLRLMLAMYLIILFFLADGNADDSNGSQEASFGALRPSIVFAGPCLAVVADGKNDCSVLNTGDRSPLAHHTWMVRYVQLLFLVSYIFFELYST